MMYKKSLSHAQFSLERLFFSQVWMVQKSYFLKLVCLAIFSIVSSANAMTCYSRLATGYFGDVSPSSINTKDYPTSPRVQSLISANGERIYYNSLIYNFLDKKKPNYRASLFYRSNQNSLSHEPFCSYNTSFYDYVSSLLKVKGSITNGLILAGQSALVKAETQISGSPIVVNNSMRKAGTNDNSVFFKATKIADPEVKIWLNFTNTEGIFKQLLIGYVPGATNGYEDSYDGTTVDANPYADFYSICDGKNLVIQGRSLPWTPEDVVVLGYRSAIVSTFAIGIDHTEGNFDNVNVFLHDKLLNVFHNLKLSPYVFTTLQGTFKERFALKYIDKSLGTGDFESDANKVVMSVKDKTIWLACTSENLKNVFVYDISGKLLYEKNKIDDTSLAIESLPTGNQVLVVKVILGNNYEISKKIIF